MVVEAAKAEGVWGWAFDEDDPGRRLVMHVAIGDRPIGTGLADHFRPDLLDNGVGDGRYGFHISISTDDYLDENGADFAVYADDEGGRTIPGTFINRKEMSDLVVHLRGGEAPRFAGASFLLDNLCAFDRQTLAAAPSTSVPGAPRGYVAMKMYGFGDFMWWEDAADQVTPTAARYFSAVGARTREAIARGTVMLLFDMSNEGVPARGNESWLALLHDELDRQAIPASACVLLTQNRLYAFDYRRWCASVGRIERMTVLPYDYYIARLAYLLEADHLPPAPKAPAAGADWRHFVCLNFTPAVVRTPFVGWLFGSGLAERGFVSFYGFANSKKSVASDAVPAWFPDRQVAAEGLAVLRDRGRILLDLPADETFAVPEFDLGPIDCYARAFFTIVTETDFSDGDLERVTEKAVKPLALGHPVVVVGNPGSLALLRSFGFRTFHPFIDESYDAVDDRAERMRLVQAEVTRLCAFSYAELVAMRRALAEVTGHNHRHARRGLAARYRDEIEPALLARLADILTASGMPTARRTIGAAPAPSPIAP